MLFPCENEGPGQGQTSRMLVPVRLAGDGGMNSQGEFLSFSSWQEMTAKFQMKQMKCTQLFRP